MKILGAILRVAKFQLMRAILRVAEIEFMSSWARQSSNISVQRMDGRSLGFFVNPASTADLNRYAYTPIDHKV